MARKSTRSLWRVCLLIALCTGAIATAEERDPPRAEMTPAIMLERLRARDAALDNYRVTFTENVRKRIDEKQEFSKRQFNIVRFGGQAEPTPESFPDPYDAVIISRRTMVVRGDDLLLSSVWTTDHHGRPKPPEEPQIFKRQTGRVVDLSSAGSDRILTISAKTKEPSAPYPDFRRFYEMSLGAGFGWCLQSIETVEPTDAGWKVSGTAKLWTEDRTKADLVVDSNLIVRHAELRVEVQGHQTRIYVATGGEIAAPNQLPVARTGTFERVVVRGNPANEAVEPVSQWELEVEQIELPLSEDRYAALTELDEKSAEHVIDQAKDK